MVHLPPGMRGLFAAIFFANLVVLPHQYRVVSRILTIAPHKVIPVLLLPLITNAFLAAVLILLVRIQPQALGVWPTPVLRIAFVGLYPLAEIARHWVAAHRVTPV